MIKCRKILVSIAGVPFIAHNVIKKVYLHLCRIL